MPVQVVDRLRRGGTADVEQLRRGRIGELVDRDLRLGGGQLGGLGRLGGGLAVDDGVEGVLDPVGGGEHDRLGGECVGGDLADHLQHLAVVASAPAARRHG